MKYFLSNYQHKGRPYADALRAARHIYSVRFPDVMIVERERFVVSGKAQQRIKRHPNTPIMIYPHSALPPWWYDGLTQIDPRTLCVFVIGEGQRDAMKIIAPEARVELTGWAWCKQREFYQPDKVQKILFMPIHPTGNTLRPEAYSANVEIAAALKEHQKRTGAKVTVRYVGNLVAQGLQRDTAFAWTRGEADGTTNEIDNADLVIAEGTAMYIAVARGVPTIGINQHLPVRTNREPNTHTPHNWKWYGDKIAYPVNFGDAPLEILIDRAMNEQSEWRARMIGGQMVNTEFAAKVEMILNAHRRTV